MTQQNYINNQKFKYLHKHKNHKLIIFYIDNYDIRCVIH